MAEGKRSARRPTAEAQEPGTLPETFANRSFDEDVWRVPVHAQGREYKMSWTAVVLADGSRLTDQKNRQFLLSAKHYIVLIAQGKGGVKRPLRGGSLIADFQNFGVLVRWLSKRNIWSLAEVTVSHVIGYRNYVNNTKTKFKKRGGAKGIVSDKKSTGLATRTRAFRFVIIKRLAALQVEMDGYGTKFTPAEVQDVLDYLFVGKQQHERTKAVPDDYFRLLLDGAIAYIRDEAPKILRIHKATLAWREHREMHPGASARLWSSPRNLEIRRGEVPKDLTVEFDGEQRTIDTIAAHDLWRLITLIRGACFIIIAGMTGMRDGEIRSLKIDCIRIRPLGKGRPNILKLAGTLYKTARLSKGIPAEWVAGYDELDNPIRQAIETLELLPRVINSSYLFASMHRTQRHGSQRVSQHSIDKCLGAFAEMLGITDWHFTPHQFRKTFARFVALSDNGSLFALMRHFKHASILMTELYASCDPEQVSDIFEASQEISAEHLDRIYGAEKLGGLAGKRIIANNSAYRGAENAKARRELIDMELADPSSYNRPLEMGMCLYEREKARCKSKIENVGLDMCLPCPNFAVGGSNLPVWVAYKGFIEDRIAEQGALGFISLELQRQLSQAKQMIVDIMEGGS